MIGLMRQRRGFRGVIVASQYQDATVLRCAGEIRMLENVAAAIDTRTFAVPHCKHAIDLRAGVQVDLLRAPDGRCGEVFVQAWLELDVVVLEKIRGLPQREIEAAERRTAIARNETGGVETRELVALVLEDEQTDQRLDAG